MPYKRALTILKNPDARAEDLLTAAEDLRMEYGTLCCENLLKKSKHPDDFQAEVLAYMSVMHALHLRICSKFRKNA